MNSFQSYCSESHQNILVLHSYSSGLSWTDDINKGIFNSFHDCPEVNIFTDFLDAKHFSGEQYFAFIKSQLQKKYADKKFDLIICSDDAAIQFLARNREQLFTGVPIVFCGANYPDSIPPGFTGIIEAVDFKDNIDLILKLHPHYQKLYIINDRTTTAQANQKVLQHLIDTQYPHLRYEYLTDYSLSQLQHKLSSLTNNDVVLLLSFTRDALGNNYAYDNLLELFLPYCKAPVYGTWDFYVGKGVVGGKIVQAYQQGVLAALMAQKILHGVPVQSIPIDTAASQFIFDYIQLKNKGINPKQLPANSLIINRPLDQLLGVRPVLYLFAILVLIVLILTGFLALKFLQIKREKLQISRLQKVINQKDEELIRLASMAEKAKKLQGAFIENLSHEIRTPLNGIIGFSGLLENPVDAATRKEYIQTIYECSEQLTGIIDDLLLIAMIDSGQIQVNKSSFHLHPFLGKLKDLFQVRDKNHNEITLGTFPLSNGEDIVYTDAQRLEKILSCILENSIKFTHKGSIELGYATNKNQLLIYVRDNGIGISPQAQKDVFKRFFREEHKTGAYGGNGLGLAICKAYVELLGGNIAISSEPGKGTLCYFTIPRQQADINELSLLSSTKYSGLQNTKLLIVDRELIYAHFIRNGLSHVFRDIIVVSEAEKALEILHSDPEIEFILFDHSLADTTGTELCRKAKISHPQVIMIMHSPFVSLEIKHKAYQAGCDLFITKPVDTNKLKKIFQKLYRNKISS